MDEHAARVDESVERPPAGGPVPGWRRAAGVAVGLLALAAVGYPVLWAGLGAYASVTGCFISCSAPEPGAAVWWSGVAVLLLLVPVVLGLTVGGARSRKTWLAAAGLVLLAVAGWDLLAVLDRSSG